jgi:hypothetical protein
MTPAAASTTPATSTTTPAAATTASRLPLPPPRPGRSDTTPTPKPLRDDHGARSPGGSSARTTPTGGIAAQPAPTARTTPVGGLAAQPAPTARTTPVGGLAAQPAHVDPAFDLDDDLAIPVEGSPPPNASFAGVIPLPPEVDDALAVPVAAADPPADARAAADAISSAASPFASASPAPLAPSPALPFASPRGEAAARFDDVTAPARPTPRASTDTTPLPPPPMSVVPGPVEHPRVPSEWIADRGDSRPVRAAVQRKDVVTDEVAPLAAPGRGGGAPTKLLMIGGGLAAVALVLIVALMRGGSSEVRTHAATPASGSAVAVAEGASSATTAGEHGDAPATQPPHDRHGIQHLAAGASGGSAEAPVGSDETVDENGSAAAESDAGSAAAPPPPAPRHHPTLGGKQVVLEYDTPSRAAPVAAPREDTAAVAKARAAYANGNQRLFAGDAAGAVRAYQQALDYYPGYVAGYRGLGLAYAQQGDKAKALQAFRTYLANAPGAKDTALIRKRERMLR